VDRSRRASPAWLASGPPGPHGAFTGLLRRGCGATAAARRRGGRCLPLARGCVQQLPLVYVHPPGRRATVLAARLHFISLSRGRNPRGNCRDARLRLLPVWFVQFSGRSDCYPWFLLAGSEFRYGFLSIHGMRPLFDLSSPRNAATGHNTTRACPVSPNKDAID